MILASDLPSFNLDPSLLCLINYEKANSQFFRDSCNWMGRVRCNKNLNVDAIERQASYILIGYENVDKQLRGNNVSTTFTTERAKLLTLIFKEKYSTDPEKVFEFIQVFNPVEQKFESKVKRFFKIKFPELLTINLLDLNSNFSGQQIDDSIKERLNSLTKGKKVEPGFVILSYTIDSIYCSIKHRFLPIINSHIIAPFQEIAIPFIFNHTSLQVSSAATSVFNAIVWTNKNRFKGLFITLTVSAIVTSVLKSFSKSKKLEKRIDRLSSFALAICNINMAINLTLLTISQRIWNVMELPLRKLSDQNRKEEGKRLFRNWQQITAEQFFLDENYQPLAQ